MVDRVQATTPNQGAQAEEYQEMAKQYTAAAREHLAAANEWVRDFVVREPAKALGIALGLGIYLGWLTKRR